MEKHIFANQYDASSEFNYFLTSDWHLEHTSHDRKLLTKEMDKAANMGARIYVNGDVYDSIILGDPRYRKSGDTSRKEGMLNEIVDDGVNFMKPYADYIDIIGMGNHEVQILNRHPFDMIEMTLKLLNHHRSKSLEPIQHGGYERFIRNKFIHKAGGNRSTFDIFQNHGQGGSAEVSLGAIDLNRYQYIEADIINIGHKHKKLMLTMPDIKRFNTIDNLVTMRRTGIVTGCYLNNIREYDIVKDGYQSDYGEERMRTTQAQGGVFIKLRVDSYRNSIYTIEY